MIALGLPARVPRAMGTDAILAAMAADKKRVARQLRFVLPLALGDVAIVDNIPTEDVATVIEEVRE